MSKRADNVKTLLRGAAIAGALAAIAAPGAVLAGKAAKASAKVACTGVNDCKGKGSCKSASNECKGQNGCKGQGMTMMKSAKACESKGGKVAEK